MRRGCRCEPVSFDFTGFIPRSLYGSGKEAGMEYPVNRVVKEKKKENT